MNLREIIREEIVKIIQEDHTIYSNTKGGEFGGDQAAGILPFCKSTKRFLLAHRSEFVNEPNIFGLWGGAIDENENPKEAALRELEEESGYTGPIKLIPLDTFIVPKVFKYFSFLGIVNEEFIPSTDNWETQGYRWVTLEEIEDMDLHPGFRKTFEKKKNELRKLVGKRND